MSNNSFTDLDILDCNRQSSTQANSQNNENNANWENKLGSGIRVNAGDQIQVNSAFISEEGAGDENTIEFSGKSLGKTSLTYLVPTIEGTFDRATSKSGAQKIIWSEFTDNDIDMADNKASIVIEFYKNMNGENYYQLPRKYLCVNSQLTANYSKNLFYAQEDSTNFGKSGTNAGGGLPYFQINFFSSTSSKLWYVDDDYYYFSGDIYDTDADNIGGQFYKLRNDNSRYTIYVAQENYYVSKNTDAGADRGIDHPAPADYWLNELSQRKYLRYKEKIDLEIKTGFNSGQAVADDISNQLNATGELENIDIPISVEDPYFKPTKNITAYLESPTYKTFLATNVTDATEDNYDLFNASHSDTAVPNQQVVNFINQTNFIGIKRPDLYDKGYIVANNLTSRTNASITPANMSLTLTNFASGDDFIETNIAWTDTNLLYLKNLFDEQSKNPELFTNRYNDYSESFAGAGTSASNTIFLHIAQRRYEDEASDPKVSLRQLGSDSIQNASSSFPLTASVNLISMPIFFFRDKNRTELAEGGTNSFDLFYGFAKKKQEDVGGEILESISFYVGADNSVLQPPVEYRNYNNAAPNGSQILAGTLIGWDTHFTAYSTCAIALSDGYIQSNWKETLQTRTDPLWINGVNTTYNSNTPVAPNGSSAVAVSPIDQTPYIAKTFLGANNPLLNYNASSNRFAISQLHTPEYGGNRADAGGSDDANALTHPLNPNANVPVFKINKRNNCFSWTPALVPYNSIVTPATDGSASFTLELPNYNFDKWKIFDAQSGIVISDFGFDEKNWNNGLWGMLGFTYNQFNASTTFNNDITERLTTRNKQSIPYAFTNALVSASDSIDFNVNAWGAPAYNLQVPVTKIWNGSGDTGDQLGKRKNFKQEDPPPITKSQTSIELVATNLPRRMVRPYYCIRSDIISESHYLGGADSGQLLPVVAIVNKIDGYGDFYFGTQSPFVFTATKSRVITSIKTSIHYPDQTYANVNSDSGVIYSIRKTQPAVANVVEELLGEMNKKEQKQFLSKF